MSADFKGNVVDDLGNVQPTSTVTVKDVNGALIPAGELFSDAALTIPFAANPFTTDAQGNMNFFIEPQTVNITAQKGVFVKTWDDYVLNEQIDTSDFATAAQGTLADSATQPGDLGDIAGDDKTSPSAIVWDDGNYQPTQTLGLGVVRMMKNTSGIVVNSGQIIAGAGLKTIFFSGTGAFFSTSGTVPGTWMNVSGSSVLLNYTKDFVRIT